MEATQLKPCATKSPSSRYNGPVVAMVREINKARIMPDVVTMTIDSLKASNALPYNNL